MTTRWPGKSQYAHDGHKLRRKDKRSAAKAQIRDGVANMMEFQAQVKPPFFICATTQSC